MRGFLFVLAIALASCSPAQSIPVTQGVPFEGQDPGAVREGQMWPSRILNSTAVDRWVVRGADKTGPYVYVADGKVQSLVVYRYGYAGSPIRSVALDGAPFAVATDRKGRVYVSEQLASEVQVFDSGAGHALGKLAGVSEPDGIATANGKVYVANHPLGKNPYGYVSVYSEGSMNTSAIIESAPSFAPLGVAVDGAGDVFEVAMGHVGRGTGGVLLEYAPGTSGSDYTRIALLCECAIRGGIAMDGYGNVMVGNLGHLTTFEKPDFTRSRTVSVPGAGILGFFTHSAFGTFVPLNDGDGKSEVIVYPERGAMPYYVVRAGMETPQGAAGGP